MPLITKADIANRQRNEGKLSALQQVVESLRLTLADGETEVSLRERADRLQAAIDDVTATMGEHIQQQAVLGQGQREIQNEYNDRYRRLSELNDLTNNFSLLARKYESDLERLGMLEEAGTLLGYFDVGACVFCGASPEYQSVQAHQVEDRSLFAESVRAEQEKTRSLRQDLEYAIGDLESEKRREESAIEILSSRQRDVERAALELDERIRPRQAELGDLLSARSEIERRLAAYDQMRQVDEMTASVPNLADMSSVPPSVIRNDTATAFSQLLASILNSWGVPEVSTVSFDAETGEMSTNGVPRASHGKGMRALMHAAFTIGLAQWCITRELPHPGFVVLDSPLLTYKEPETAEDHRLAESAVSTEFFRYLDSTFEGQAVVLENVSPPDLSKSAKMYEFTKGSRGRYGFFPQMAD
ncbi:hypothetical protein [Micromonospora sp. NPDC049102]|uniref:hypothetical protein n=1 Tax=Micromonospora sp. NPDC049102 TaxID=3364265 RepID=UPI00371C845C